MSTADRRKGPELIQGTLDMLILKVLDGSVLHGFAIAERIHQISDEVLRVEEGALYPALHRLEVRGWLASHWGFSASNRRAKYYRLTALGRRQLQAQAEQWSRLSAAVARIMEGS
jgi:transcriptional regulator